MAHDYNEYDNAMENSGISKLGDIYFKCIEEETYSYSNDITEKPVEDGSILTDHIKNKLLVIKLSGIFIGENEYPQEDLTTLRYYAINGDILKYIGVQSFSKCVIESFENKHTSSVANGIEFSMTLKEVRIATKEEISINTSSLTIPDIEALKDELSAQKAVKKAAITARVKGTSTKSRQGKQAKVKQTVLEKIQARY